MRIAIPKESLKGETRVAATPNTVAQLQKLGFEVAVERGAGVAAGLTDAAFEEAGAVLVNAKDAWSAPLIYKVNAPNDKEINRLHEGQTLVSFLYPRQNEELVQKLTIKKSTCWRWIWCRAFRARRLWMRSLLWQIFRAIAR